MKNLPMILKHRDRERGTVALLVAVMWTTLFGMAVVAIDFGYLYTKKRGLQSTADAALIASMPLFKTAGGGNAGVAAARPRVLAVAASNLYVPDTATSVEGTLGANANQFKVTVGRTHPTFFGGIFGLRPRSITASATAELAAGGSGGSAIHASGPGCSAQYLGGGVLIGGQGFLVVDGDITTTNNKVEVASWGLTCNPASTCRITGTASSACAVYNDSPAKLGIATIGSTSTPDPLAGNNLLGLAAFCTVGDFVAVLDMTGYWNAEAGGCQVLQSNVYCSGGDIAVAPTGPSKSMCPSTATFITPGKISITGDGNINLSSYAGPSPVPPNRLIAFTDAGGNCGGPAINISNGPGNSLLQMNGAIHAPNGCINMSSNTLTVNYAGTVSAGVVQIQMGDGMAWTFTGPSGGGGGGPPWTIVQ